MGLSTANVTVSAPVGAGEVATAVTMTDITSITFDIKKEMVFVKLNDGRTVDYAYDTVATVTWLITARVATVVIAT